MFGTSENLDGTRIATRLQLVDKLPFGLKCRTSVILWTFRLRTLRRRPLCSGMIEIQLLDAI